MPHNSPAALVFEYFDLLIVCLSYRFNRFRYALLLCLLHNRHWKNRFPCVFPQHVYCSGPLALHCIGPYRFFYLYSPSSSALFLSLWISSAHAVQYLTPHDNLTTAKSRLFIVTTPLRLISSPFAKRGFNIITSTVSPIFVFCLISVISRCVIGLLMLLFYVHLSSFARRFKKEAFFPDLHNHNSAGRNY